MGRGFWQHQRLMRPASCCPDGGHFARLREQRMEGAMEEGREEFMHPRPVRCESMNGLNFQLCAPYSLPFRPAPSLRFQASLTMVISTGPCKTCGTVWRWTRWSRRARTRTLPCAEASVQTRCVFFRVCVLENYRVLAIFHLVSLSSCVPERRASCAFFCLCFSCVSLRVFSCRLSSWTIGWL